MPNSAVVYYIEEKARRGSHAAFLGVRLTRDTTEVDTYQWQAMAVGDCCLFHFRCTQVHRMFPLTRSTAFGTNPDLLSTDADYTAQTIKYLLCAGGTLKNTEMLVLVTDALAEWIMRQVEAENTPCAVLAQLTTTRDFEGWVERLRATKELRNDDVTLLVLDFCPHRLPQDTPEPHLVQVPDTDVVEIPGAQQAARDGEATMGIGERRRKKNMVGCLFLLMAAIDVVLLVLIIIFTFFAAPVPSR